MELEELEELEELDEYKKDFKKLSKKYRTLSSDIEVVKKVLSVKPKERPPFSFRIDNLGIETCVIKVKKIASKSFKGKGVNSGLRLIYAHYEAEDKIVLIEIYHKSKKKDENRGRIRNNFK
jgi:mRNA-degrading endonuclease RelE of RelBE toxin-antitoxin system